MKQAQTRFILVFGIALAFRAAFLFSVGSDPRMALTPDSYAYLTASRNLLDEGVFSVSENAPFKPETGRTPGYPVFLIPFVVADSPQINAAVWTQAMLGAATAGLVQETAFVLWAGPTAAICAGLLLALDFVVALHEAYIGTEAVFLFVFVAGLYVFCLGLKSMRYRHFALAGIIFGVAALVRPVGIYYFVPPALLMLGFGLRQRPVFRTGVVFLLASLLVPALWMSRNAQVAGSWAFTTVEGLTRAGVYEEYKSGRPYEQVLVELEKDFQAAQSESRAGLGGQSTTLSGWSIRHMLRDPVALARMVGRESVRFLAGNGMKAAAWMLFKDPHYDPMSLPIRPKGDNSSELTDLVLRHPSLGIALAAYLCFLACIYVLAMVGFVRAIREHGPMIPLILAASFFYFFVASVGMGVHSRYRIPAMPALALLGGYGFQQVLARRRYFNRETVEVTPGRH